MGGSIEPGWYADPEGAKDQLRWWDGGDWTQHVRSLAELSGEPGSPAPGDRQGESDIEATTDLSGLLGRVPAEESPDGATVNLGTGPATTDLDDEPTADLSDHAAPDGATVNLGTGPATTDLDDEPTADLSDHAAPDGATVNLGTGPATTDLDDEPTADLSDHAAPDGAT
ncbi:DUF2510 domain-containing protein, partial [Nocardiopsis ansamitocini]|uniref:DUF2510 domain-containing protein n=1 Tax=Nocardiopsis ansamitocini TaxID=1670832 RepID=UPI0025572551